MLRVIHFLSSTKKLPASFVDEFVEVEAGDVGRLLGSLYSILSVPEDKTKMHYRFYHLSFPEFLSDPLRSKDFYIPDDVWINHFVLRYLALYQSSSNSSSVSLFLN